MDKIELIVERDWLKQQLAASEDRAKRLEEACAAALPVIANAIVHGMPVTKGVATARNLLAAALAEPAADAGEVADA